MATENSTTNAGEAGRGISAAGADVGFHYAPALGRHLFYVPGDLSRSEALSAEMVSSIFQTVVRDALTEAVQSPMDGNLAYVCELLLDASRALNDAAAAALREVAHG